jgi:hypothetical protein
MLCHYRKAMHEILNFITTNNYGKLHSGLGLKEFPNALLVILYSALVLAFISETELTFYYSEMFSLTFWRNFNRAGAAGWM